MHTSVRFIILSLLVTALISLGIARAEGVPCPAHCGIGVEPAAADQAGHPCCDGPAGKVADDAGPLNDGQSPQPAACGHCYLFPGSNERGDVAMGLNPAGVDTAFGFSSLAGYLIAHPSPAGLPIRPLPPRLRKAPDLFTRNCSFLI